METVKVIPREDLEGAVAIAEEYLVEDAQRFTKMYNKYPDLFVGFYIDNQLIGICYGYPFKEQRPNDTRMLLQGIAIVYPYAAAGRGSKLIALFEEQVKQSGPWLVSVGSAEGYPEKFYLKNGYKPVEYCFKLNTQQPPSSFENKGYTISKIINNNDETIAYIPTTKYDPEKQQAIKTAFGAQEVIYIFEKQL